METLERCKDCVCLTEVDNEYFCDECCLPCKYIVHCCEGVVTEKTIEKDDA